MTGARLPRLWLIADRGHQPDDVSLFAKLDAMRPHLAGAAGDVGVIERDHTGLADRARLARLEALAELLRSVGAPLWVNRRADLALAVGARGVVAMGASLDLATLRSNFKELEYCASCHTSDELARAAADGARFALLAPVFNPSSKPPERPPLGLDGLRAIASDAPLPLVALGGIDSAHVTQALAAGAHGVAILGGIFGAPAPAEALATALTALPKAR